MVYFYFKTFISFMIFTLSLFTSQPVIISSIASNVMIEDLRSSVIYESNETEYNEEKEQEIIEKYKPNEMGSVMVLMYHNLVDSDAKEGHYARSFKNFRKDLERIHSEGYYLITLNELVNGRISVPAGKIPMVITVDDGYSTDIKFLENGEVDPNTVVGIMEAMKKEHPDFNAVASFYIFSHKVFGENPMDSKKVEYLLSRGYEIGNHTLSHENLKKISTDEVKRQILEQQKYISSYTDINNFTFSVPFGVKPDNFDELVSDQSWLKPYKMTASLNVGWNPIKSPYSVNFNPFSINRITVGDDEAELHFWLDEMKDSKNRFVSDGNPDVITVPSDYAENLNRDKLEKDFKIVVYDKE